MRKDKLPTDSIKVPGGDNREDLPLATLIICSRNRPQLPEDTIQSILDGDEVPAEIVIVVIKATHPIQPCPT